MDNMTDRNHSVGVAQAAEGKKQRQTWTRHGVKTTSGDTRQTIKELEQFYAAHDGKVVERLQWLFSEPLEN